MMFTNHNSQKSYIQNIVKNSDNFRAMPFSLAARVVPPIRQEGALQQKEREAAAVAEAATKTKSMKWGEPIWNLFHTMAEKVREEKFPAIRAELLNIIYSICLNLPCPDCANHATQFLNNNNFNRIQTKSQLREFFFRFHNEVNQRKHFPLFPRTELENKYSVMNFGIVLRVFMYHFQDKHKSVRMIANDFHRGNIAERLKLWFNANIQSFI